jgi:hypothetical protein
MSSNNRKLITTSFHNNVYNSYEEPKNNYSDLQDKITLPNILSENKELIEINNRLGNYINSVCKKFKIYFYLINFSKKYTNIRKKVKSWLFIGQSIVAIKD